MLSTIRIAATLAGALLLIEPASGQQPPAPAAKADAFDIQVFPVRIDRALDRWTHVPMDVAPKFGLVSTVCPGEVIAVLVFLNHIGDDGHGQGHVTFDFEEQLVNGELGLHDEGVVAWDGKLPPASIVVLSDAVMGISFEETDPRGTRTFSFKAHDAASGATAERSFDVALHDWTYGDEPAKADDLQPWLDSYSVVPEPSQAVRAFLEFASLQDEKAKTWNFAVVGFFRTAFEDDPWLVDHLVTTARSGGEDKQLKTAFLLQFLGLQERLDDLYGDSAHPVAVRAMLKGLAMPDAYGPIETAAQLDLLWGEFFASGRYKPVRQIVSALELFDEKDPVETYKASAKGADDRAALMRGLAARAALWSLQSNGGRLTLVGQYLTWMLDNEKLSSKERNGLSAVLKVIQDRAHETSPPKDAPPH